MLTFIQSCKQSKIICMYFRCCGHVY